MSLFPECSDDIERVREHPSFYVTDLTWIAATLGITIRLTVDANIYSELREWFPWLRRDSFFGKGDTPHSAHLYFSWSQAAEEDRRFGHYDLLVPCYRSSSDLLLVSDASRFECKYIWCFIFLLFSGTLTLGIGKVWMIHTIYTYANFCIHLHIYINQSSPRVEIYICIHKQLHCLDQGRRARYHRW